MQTVLIRNGHLVDPSQGIDEICDVLIDSGRVARVGKTITGQISRVIDAHGMTVIPGLVDMHVHLRDPGFTEKEDIHTGCNAAVAGGVTSVLCMPNTKPPVDNAETIRYIQETAARAKARVWICGAATAGMRGNNPADYEMYRSMGVVAVSDDGRPVENEAVMEQVMRSAAEKGLRVVSHCEDLKIVNGGIMHRGSVSEELCVPGIDRASEDSITAREIEIARRTGAPVHICHVSTKGSVELVRRAKAEGVPVTCETCPHYFVYTHDKLRTRDANYRMNPPLREQEDVEAILEGIADGTIDCIVTDHAPHTKKEKQDFLHAPNGVTGLETSLAAGLRFLVEPGVIPMPRLIELMAWNPARILGIEAGSLRPGMPADLAIVDTSMFWTVLPERMQSKATNTAFQFEQLKGRVRYTLVGGEIAYIM